MVEIKNETSEQGQCESDCDCEGAKWDPKKEVDRLLNELDEEETNLKKISETAHKYLQAMSLNDACEYLADHNAPVTNENIDKFLLIAQKAYLIKLNIMSELVLGKN